MQTYNPSDWYWVVGGDTTQVYSSKAGDYVTVSDATYIAWLADGNVATRIQTTDDLADVLAAASVRPTRADMLDKYKGFQANRLTMEVVAKVLFNHENRLRALSGQQTITAQQFANALKAML